MDCFRRTCPARFKHPAKLTGIKSGILTLHNLCRFFASQCADPGIPRPTVTDWLGLDEMKMVMLYYQFRDEGARRMMEKFTVGQEGQRYPKRTDKSGKRGRHRRSGLSPATVLNNSAVASDDTAHHRATRNIRVTTHEKPRSHCGNAVQRRGGDSFEASRRKWLKTAIRA